jgi:hypothetical protein
LEVIIWIVGSWNLFTPLSSKESRNDVFSNMHPNFFSNNIFMNRFLVPFFSRLHSISFQLNIWIQFNLIQLLNWIYLNFNPNSMYLNLIQLYLNWIYLNLNWIPIQFNLHAMSFNIFIWMELNFHKINSFFHQLISWLSLVVCSNVKLK